LKPPDVGSFSALATTWKLPASAEDGTLDDAWVELPPEHPDYAGMLAAALKLRAQRETDKESHRFSRGRELPK
jgi:hypothetical protein